MINILHPLPNTAMFEVYNCIGFQTWYKFGQHKLSRCVFLIVKNAYQTKCTFPPNIPPQTPSSQSPQIPLPHSPPPSMNLLGPI